MIRANRFARIALRIARATKDIAKERKTSQHEVRAVARAQIMALHSKRTKENQPKMIVCFGGFWN